MQHDQLQGARFWSSMSIPIRSARDTILNPLKTIGINLVNAWDLGDLMEDLKFQATKPANI